MLNNTADIITTKKELKKNDPSALLMSLIPITIANIMHNAPNKKNIERPIC